jgi:hypothetical protein
MARGVHHSQRLPPPSSFDGRRRHDLHRKPKEWVEKCRATSYLFGRHRHQSGTRSSSVDSRTEGSPPNHPPRVVHRQQQPAATSHIRRNQKRDSDRGNPRQSHSTRLFTRSNRLSQPLLRRSYASQISGIRPRRHPETGSLVIQYISSLYTDSNRTVHGRGG